MKPFWEIVRVPLFSQISSPLSLPEISGSEAV